MLLQMTGDQLLSTGTLVTPSPLGQQRDLQESSYTGESLVLLQLCRCIDVLVLLRLSLEVQK